MWAAPPHPAGGRDEPPLRLLPPPPLQNAGAGPVPVLRAASGTVPLPWAASGTVPLPWTASVPSPTSLPVNQILAHLQRYLLFYAKEM